ncbi:MAG: MBL fold metallo-hydrolase [Candidatus Helarchaeota archaeon]
MATSVKTPDLTIVIDPGCSLGQRMHLDPHPQEYHALMQANKRLLDACNNAEVLLISHYHYDHLKPTFTDYHFILSNPEFARSLYTDKIIYAKDFRENINNSQRQRGYYFKKFTKKYVKSIQWADGGNFEIGNTHIIVSPPLPHGEVNSRQGFVLVFQISYEDDSFVFATVQGPFVSDTCTFLLSLNPSILYIGGPPTYLSGFRIPETSFQFALTNMIELVTHIPQVIFDHHLLRDVQWATWASPIFQTSKNHNHWVGTAADYLKQLPKPLEAKRKTLYLQDPPSKEFIHWSKQSEKFKKENLPPPLETLF